MAINHGMIAFEMKISITSAFKPPAFTTDTIADSPCSTITKFTISVIIAVFRN